MRRAQVFFLHVLRVLRKFSFVPNLALALVDFRPPGTSLSLVYEHYSVSLALDQVCVVLNNKGVRVCTVCKSPYKASVRLPGGESISLFQSPLPPPYICFMVVTRHQNNEVSLTECARNVS